MREHDTGHSAMRNGRSVGCGAVECATMAGDSGSRRSEPKEISMSKRARKRRSRKGKGANHGKRPNA